MWFLLPHLHPMVNPSNLIPQNLELNFAWLHICKRWNKSSNSYDLGMKYYKDEKKEMIVLKFNWKLQERQNALRKIIYIFGIIESNPFTTNCNFKILEQIEYNDNTNTR